VTQRLALSLNARLIGAFALIAIVAVALVALFMQQANIGGLRRIVLERERAVLAESLAEFYGRAGSWQNVRQHVDSTLGVRSAARAGDTGGPPTKGGPPRTAALPAVVDADGIVVLPISDYPLGTQVPPAVLASDASPVVVGGQRVGWVLLLPPRDSLGPEEAIYIERTNRALWLGSLGGIVVALMIGLFLARRMTAPLRALTDAAGRMAAGHLEQQVPVQSRDEIGQLATAFNQMSQEVALQTQLRRQMTADIAHDLRTPLTSIAGYVEAFEEGDLEPTPERLKLVATEVQHLQQLVSDLRMLSQADAGELRLNLQALPPVALVERAAAAHRRNAEQRGVELRVAASVNGAEVYVDEARMARVFDNLVDNAIQHTPEGGRIVLEVAAAADEVIFTVRDSGKGIAPEDVPHVFNRFYRADKARGSDGHSGLGLAIVRALVEAHGGSVRAASRVGVGTEMIAVLPANHAA
jgi:two-component system sensor histidine kinase BaeS